jgi:hypothetical protein
MKTTCKDFISQYWMLLLIIVLKMILQYVVVNPVYELHRDEFLHLDQANHLSFGFISVPPFTSLVSKLIYMLGGSMFWIKFFPALFGALTIAFAWLIVETLGGKLLSKILVSTALLFSAMARINMLFQPNSFDILAWTMIFYLLLKYVQSEKPKWLYLLAIVIAIGMYNKYNPAFLLIGLTAGLLLNSQRHILLKSSLWKAVLLLVILLLPNIIWQVIHHFPVMEHMKALKSSQLDNNTSAGFLKDQVLFFSGSLLLIVSAMVAFIYFRPFRPYRFVGLTFVLVIVLFAFLKAKGYYAIGLYPVILAFGSVYIERIFKRYWKPVVVSSLIMINLMVFILTVKIVYPIYSPSEIIQHTKEFEKLGMLRWEDGQNHALPQDFADMIGWKEMALKSLKAYKMIPVDELKYTLVFCDNYGQVGALNYYNRSKMPEAYSFNTDYIYWLPRLTLIKNILLVGKEPDKEIIHLFFSYKIIDSVGNAFAREKGTKIILLSGAKPEFTEIFYKKAEERKATFDIF